MPRGQKRTRDSSDSSDSDSDDQPSFEERYPKLHKKTHERRVNPKDIVGHVKDIIMPSVVDNYEFVRALADAYLRLVDDSRDEAGLPELEMDANDIANEVFIDFLGSQAHHAEEVASKMPLKKFNTSKSFEELMQLCYDTTKTDDFKEAVQDVMEHSSVFLHALDVFRKDRANRDMETFLLKYSKALYNKHMNNIQINISF